MKQPRIAKGSREYLLDRAELLADMMAVCAETFTRFGGRRVIPSTMVAYEDVAEPARAISFTEPETGRLLALRQDLTHQIRRIVDMELQHLPTPYKLFYIERVWHSRSEGSRAKEQIQAGLEWIAPETDAELELLELVADLVATLTGTPATLVLGDARLRKAWLATLQLKDPVRAIEALDTRNLSLWRETGDPAFADLPMQVVMPHQDTAKFPESVQSYIDALTAITKGLPDNLEIRIDPIGTAEQSYYNGMFFAVASGLESDPWLRGGRYDGRFSAPGDAIGFALDLDPLVEAADAKRIRPSIQQK